MTLSSKRLAELVRAGNGGDRSGISIIPAPDLRELADSGEAAVNLRLGRWFLTMKQTAKTHLDTVPDADSEGPDAKLAKRHFVPFGSEFVVHPNRFVLASTLEWIRLPIHLAAYVAGKSTWGRRGIVIETAAGVHPSFSGCLTLEIANLGEVPIRLRPGMQICQIFVHELVGDTGTARTSLAGRRRPVLGAPKPDKILQKLSSRTTR